MTLGKFLALGAILAATGVLTDNGPGRR